MLNLHCYQEENQDTKFSQIAKAIDDLDIDVVCLTGGGRAMGERQRDWNSIRPRSFATGCASTIICIPIGRISALTATVKSIAVLNRYDFLMTDAGYVSPATMSIASTPARSRELLTPIFRYFRTFVVRGSF